MSEIQAMFSRITPAYDRLNFLLSFGLDRRWRRHVLNALRRHAPLGTTLRDTSGSFPRQVLDVCTGTGDLAFLLSRHGYEVTGLDFCAPMLEKAKKKAPKGVSLTFIEADAAHLPYPDRSFQAVTNAFSLRNLPNLRAAFLETYRVLVQGGVAAFLDLTAPAAWLWPFHSFYLRWVVPQVGKLISGDAEAYHYLSESILRFKSSGQIKEILEACFFRQVTAESLSGGICTLWTARK